jgi:hypothetical protein
VEGSLYRSLLRATSLSWRGRAKEAQTFTDYEQDAIDGQLGKVHLVRPNGTAKDSRREIKVNLSGSSGRFPLTIANELDQSVRVGIRVQSLNRTDLRIEPLTTVTLRAKDKATFHIQASAEQNGLIRASAQVISAAGRPVGPPRELGRGGRRVRQRRVGPGGRGRRPALRYVAGPHLPPGPVRAAQPRPRGAGRSGSAEPAAAGPDRDARRPLLGITR